MLNKEELLKKCDERINELKANQKDTVDTIMYLLDNRGVNRNGSLYFEFYAGHLIAAMIEPDANREKIYTNIEKCISKIFDCGGGEKLEQFVTYVATIAIPNFNVGLKIPNFSY